MSKLSRQGWWAMFKLHCRGGELCQNCPGQDDVQMNRQRQWAMSRLPGQGGELRQNCPCKAGGLCSNYTGKAVSYVKIVPARLRREDSRQFSLVGLIYSQNNGLQYVHGISSIHKMWIPFLFLSCLSLPLSPLVCMSDCLSVCRSRL